MADFRTHANRLAQVNKVLRLLGKLRSLVVQADSVGRSLRDDCGLGGTDIAVSLGHFMYESGDEAGDKLRDEVIAEVTQVDWSSGEVEGLDLTVSNSEYE